VARIATRTGDSGANSDIEQARDRLATGNAGFTEYRRITDEHSYSFVISRISSHTLPVLWHGVRRRSAIGVHDLRSAVLQGLPVMGVRV
jgi:hypothetical protein